MSKDLQKQQYQKNYQEFNLLGRGNYGSAYLVKNLIDGEHYVAKKMMLDGMPEKEIALAWGQIQILKKFNDLNIPFIVQYKECFHFQNTLIIIMQYCEHGDLSTFLKNWKKKGEPLDQRVVVNWFIQLLFGVKTLHSKNVLHRDLKSANVFLTSNKTLKIGDFGISKVLDNTSAKTFVGTPYYLSPEVCQNRPYSLQSDLWSLGCIIYEMCTLTYPFQASNLLGLAMKILSDQVKPISNYYSKDLNDILMKLFIKNQKKRITIDEIFKTPLIKKHLITFVQDQQKINQLIPIGKKIIKTNEEQELKEKTIKKEEAQDTMKTINSVLQNSGRNDTLNFSQSLTPAERLKLKKQEQVKKRQAQLRQAANQNASIRNFAKQKKNQSLSTSGNNFGKTNLLEKQFQKQNKQKADMKRTTKQFQKNQIINTQELSQTVSRIRKLNNSVNHANFEEVELPQGLQSMTLKTMYVDQRPIKGKKQYPVEQQIHQEEQLQEYYDEDFQEYIEEPGSIMKSTSTKQQFQQIKAFYQNQLGESSLSPSKRQKVKNAFKTEEISILNPNKKIQTNIDNCIKLVGQKNYKKLYNQVKNNEIDYKKMKNVYSADQIKVIKAIDQIIYYESC